jgi:hypothetical protein
MVHPFSINLFVYGTQRFHGTSYHPIVCFYTVAVILSHLLVLASLQLFANYATAFLLGPQVKRLLVFHQICQVMLLSALLDVQETVCVATLVSVYVSLGGVVVLVQYQLVLAIVFAMAMVIVQPMKLAHALKGLVVHHAVLSTVPIEIYATEMVFAALQMFALVMMDMKELTAPIAGAIFVIFLVSVLCAPFV